MVRYLFLCTRDQISNVSNFPFPHFQDFIASANKERREERETLYCDETELYYCFHTSTPLQNRPEVPRITEIRMNEISFSCLDLRSRIYRIFKFFPKLFNIALQSINIFNFFMIC